MSSLREFHPKCLPPPSLPTGSAHTTTRPVFRFRLGIVHKNAWTQWRIDRDGFGVRSVRILWNFTDCRFVGKFRRNSRAYTLPSWQITKPSERRGWEFAKLISLQEFRQNRCCSAEENLGRVACRVNRLHECHIFKLGLVGEFGWCKAGVLFGFK
jgi:hypothetical protein